MVARELMRRSSYPFVWQIRARCGRKHTGSAQAFADQFLGEKHSEGKGWTQSVPQACGSRVWRPRALPRPARPLSPPQPQGRGGLRGLRSSASATHRRRRIRRTPVSGSGSCAILGGFCSLRPGVGLMCH